MLVILAGLSKHIVEPPSPSPPDFDYWTEEAKAGRAQRRRNRVITGVLVVALVATIVAGLAALAKRAERVGGRGQGLRRRSAMDDAAREA